jgi:predicted nucleic acid-binding protein
MADLVVVDTGPLIALARVEVLDLVGRLPFQFICPREVRQELDEGSRLGYPPVHPHWLRTFALEVPPHPVSRATLDLGEAAVIELALHQGIERVCIDDWKGRRAALASGLKVTGSLGLLARAKNEGLLSAVRPLVERLSREGIWYDPKLIQRMLKELGE